MIVAGIVLYNPDLIRLKENIDAILPQVDFLLLVDNGSNNINKVKQVFTDVKIIVLENGENKGIAFALNVIANQALMRHAEWVLTLDQDSVVMPDIIKKYEDVICKNHDKQVASLTCDIKDRNFDYESTGEEEKYVSSCITSGNYINLEAWKKISGFDEKYFIDKVDTDYCFRLLNGGFRIIKIPYTGILHEVGSNTKRYCLFGKRFVVFNHSAFRVYYIIRNQIYFARKHRKSLGNKKYYRYVRTAWTRVLVYLCFEDKKIDKVKAWIKGLCDGYRLAITEEDEL